MRADMNFSAGPDFATVFAKCLVEPTVVWIPDFLQPASETYLNDQMFISAWDSAKKILCLLDAPQEPIEERVDALSRHFNLRKYNEAYTQAIIELTQLTVKTLELKYILSEARLFHAIDPVLFSRAIALMTPQILSKCPHVLGWLNAFYENLPTSGQIEWGRHIISLMARQRVPAVSFHAFAECVSSAQTFADVGEINAIRKLADDYKIITPASSLIK
jgi:hypothetical protein